MRADAFMAREAFARLSRRIAEIEGRPQTAGAIGDRRADVFPDAVAGQDKGVLTLGAMAADRLLGGGLRRNALHEIHAGVTREAGAAIGFAMALLSRLARLDPRPVLLILEAGAVREGGRPYGPGLDRFGLDPGRLVVVEVERAGEGLWVFEEGLRCAGLAAVLCELRGRPKALDLVASRRLALRAREGGVMGLLLRQAGAAEPGAAETRWRVAPRPAGTFGDFVAGIGRPAWGLSLERNRAGRTGHLDLEWDHDAFCFAPAQPTVPALPVGGPAASVERPHLAQPSGTVVALRRAG